MSSPCPEPQGAGYAKCQHMQSGEHKLTRNGAGAGGDSYTMEVIFWLYQQIGNPQ